jgi:hypothetical protein
MKQRSHGTHQPRGTLAPCDTVLWVGSLGFYDAVGLDGSLA